MDSKGPIYFETAAKTRETVRQRTSDSRYPAIPSPVLTDNLKKSLVLPSRPAVATCGGPVRFYNSGDLLSNHGNVGAVEDSWVHERLVLNALIVGAGPTGVSVPLRAIENKLNHLIRDKGEICRTVA
jgi:hypothetical protein